MKSVIIIFPDGSRVQSNYSNNLSNKENLISEIISGIFHSGDIMDIKLRKEAEKVIKRGMFHWTASDVDGTLYLAKFD